MHISAAIRTPAAILILLIAAVSAGCRNAEPTPAEIVARSRIHFDAAKSFETNTIHYFNPKLDEPTGSNRMRIEPPGNFLFLTPEGSARIIAIDNTLYRPAETEPGKWTQSIGESAIGNTNEQNLLVGFFPPTFFDAELVDSENDVYVVEGFGTVYNNLGLPSGRATWHRLEIRKSDFALIESTKFDFPTVFLDEDGKITQTIPPPTSDDGTNPLAHMRSVTNVSRYNEDFSIEAPPEADIIIELLRTWPKDLELDVSPRDEIGFRLSEATPIMDLSIAPDIQLVPTEIDHPTLNEFPGVKYFKPKGIWGRDTTYTATLAWGESEGELKTESWTFTTR